MANEMMGPMDGDWMKYLQSNQFQTGLMNMLAASQPQYAVGSIPRQTGMGDVGLATAQGMQQGRQQDARAQFADVVKNKGFAGLMDDPQAMGLMAEFDPDTFAKGLMAHQAALAKAKYGSGTAPMQNYAAREKLVDQYGEGSPEVRQFDTYVRANPWINLGGSMALPNVQNPSQPTANIPKTPPPEQMPGFKGAQAEAAALGTGRGEERAETEKLGADAGKIVDLTKGVEDIIQKSTGSGLGTMVDSLGRFFCQATEGAVAGATLKTLQASLLRFVPRMEGPQSDFDRKSYEEAIGKLGDTTLTREERIASLNEVRKLAQKYQFYGDVFVPGAGTTGKYAPTQQKKAGGTSSTGVPWSIK